MDSGDVNITVRTKSTRIKAMISNAVGILLTGMLVVLVSCNSSDREAQDTIQAKDTMKITEGVVKYSISYPALNSEKLSPFLPEEITFVFKGSLSSYIIRSGLGTVKIVRLLDYDKQEFISLLIDTWGQNYACKETPEDILQKENSVRYDYEFSGEEEIFDELTGAKASVTNRNDGTVFEIYYAPNITIHNWNSPYKELDKLLLAYPFQENGMDMYLKLKDIEPREIDSSFFTVKGNFEWVSRAQFNSHLRSLQK